ncbi:MAG: hypothetical protein ACE5KI_04270 [Dehalococcoidia bacterium]
MTTDSLKKMIAMDPRADEAPVESIAMAPRLDTLNGKRVGLLFDGRLNGDKLLWMVADLIKEQYETGEVNFWARPNVSDISPPDLMDEMASKADVGLIAIGD